MNLTEYLKKSLQKAITRAGNMRRLAQSVGVNYATINRFNSGIQGIDNMPVKTLNALFPEMQIYCFPEDAPLQHSAPTVEDEDIINEISKLVKNLQPREKVKLLTMIAANFPDSIVNEMK